MPPYCDEHAMFHNEPFECGRMRRAERESRAAAVRRARAERIARIALDGRAYEPRDRLSFARALEVATEAAYAALTEKERA